VVSNYYKADVNIRREFEQIMPQRGVGDTAVLSYFTALLLGDRKSYSIHIWQ